MIYFISDGKAIKIGWTSGNPYARRSSLQVGHPSGLSVLAVAPGSREEEAMYHERFRAVRASGEWFYQSPNLLTLVRLLSDTEYSRNALSSGPPSGRPARGRRPIEGASPKDRMTCEPIVRKVYDMSLLDTLYSDIKNANIRSRSA